jgi:hypothetical protein
LVLWFRLSPPRGKRAEGLIFEVKI